MKFCILGGDRRQLALADYIARQGFSVETAYLGADTRPSGAADVAVLPLPASRNGTHLHAPLHSRPVTLQEALADFRGKLIFGGLLPTALPSAAEARDYYRDEGVLLANAALTAEGALALAITHTPFALAGAPVLVTGSGRIALLLAQKLRLLGAEVTAAVRRSEAAAFFRAQGLAARLYEDAPYRRFRLVLNTVPAAVLTEERLRLLPRGAVLIELASAPGGFSAARAEALGHTVVQAGGLPGRFAPESAAAAIGDYILKEIDNHA